MLLVSKKIGVWNNNINKFLIIIWVGVGVALGMLILLLENVSNIQFSEFFF
jgi:hypothetical protein